MLSPQAAAAASSTVLRLTPVRPAEFTL